MRNNKGQALVEFVLVLPVLLFLIMAFIDIANLFYSKYQLENHMDQIVEFYEEGKMEQLSQYALKENMQIDLQKGTTFTTITIEKTKKMHTPFLKEKLSKIEIERTVYSYEEK